MMIFLVAYFLEPPQDLVPYAQRVVRYGSGGAALNKSNAELVVIYFLVDEVNDKCFHGVKPRR